MVELTHNLGALNPREHLWINLLGSSLMVLALLILGKQGLYAQPSDPSLKEQSNQQDNTTPYVVSHQPDSTYLRSDRIRIMGDFASSGGITFSPVNKIPGYHDAAGVLSTSIILDFTLIEADPDIEHSGDLVLHSAFKGGFSGSQPILTTVSSQSARIMLSLSYLYAQYNNFLNINHLNLWMGHRRIGSGSLTAAGDRFGISGLGIQTRIKEYMTIAADFGLHHNLEVGYRLSNRQRINATIPQYSPQALPMHLEYDQFIHVTGEEKFRTSFIGRLFFEIPFGRNDDYDSAHTFLRLALTTQAAPPTAGGYLNPSPGIQDQDYGKPHLWPSTGADGRKADTIGFPAELGFVAATALVIEDLGIIRRNTFRAGYKNGIAAYSNMPASISSSLTEKIDPSDPSFKITQSARSLSKVHQFYISDEIDFEKYIDDIQIIQWGFSLGGSPIRTNYQGTRASSSLDIGASSTWVATEFFHFAAKLKYKISFLGRSIQAAKNAVTTQAISAVVGAIISFDGPIPRPQNYLSFSGSLVWLSPGYIRIHVQDFLGRDITDATINPGIGFSASFGF